jgi:acetyltransferase-like isoleucine patch superfamily enzyme
MLKDCSSEFSKIRRFLEKPFQEKVNLLETLLYRLKGALYYRRVFGSFGSGSVLFQPLLLSNPQFIHIGRNVMIRKGARLEAVISDPSTLPELRIGDNVNIEQNVHIVCHSRVTIGNDVSITGNCAIVDVTHPYMDVCNPVKIGDRVSSDRSMVEIGDKSFLGFNAIILPNVRIGRNCVVGAHSLVSRNVSDYTVVAGNPARVVRRYDPAEGKWVPVDSGIEDAQNASRPANSAPSQMT